MIDATQVITPMLCLIIGLIIGNHLMIKFPIKENDKKILNDKNGTK